MPCLFYMSDNAPRTCVHEKSRGRVSRIRVLLVWPNPNTHRERVVEVKIDICNGGISTTYTIQVVTTRREQCYGYGDIDANGHVMVWAMMVQCNADIGDDGIGGDGIGDYGIGDEGDGIDNDGARSPYTACKPAAGDETAQRVKRRITCMHKHGKADAAKRPYTRTMHYTHTILDYTHTILVVLVVLSV